MSETYEGSVRYEGLLARVACAFAVIYLLACLPYFFWDGELSPSEASFELIGWGVLILLGTIIRYAGKELGWRLYVGLALGASLAVGGELALLSSTSGHSTSHTVAARNIEEMKGH